jgi:hypothetical protein
MGVYPLEHKREKSQGIDRRRIRSGRVEIRGIATYRANRTSHLVSEKIFIDRRGRY